VGFGVGLAVAVDGPTLDFGVAAVVVFSAAGAVVALWAVGTGPGAPMLTGLQPDSRAVLTATAVAMTAAPRTPRMSTPLSA
jgi:hypothetical protein